ncbi:MAG TPA: VOC family protein [Polyangiaceae bacterium]|nr:VOC family protein [Polyangiaceae bacterium]
MTTANSSFIWYELMTTSADAAAKFYGDVLGWKIAGQPAELSGGMDYRSIVRSDGGMAGGVLQLTSDMLTHGAHPTWIGYLHVPDVDEAAKAIVADGGRVLMPKKTLPVGDIVMAADPMGAPFYVMRPIPPPGQPDAKSDVFDVKKSQHVRWNELQTADLPRALQFYAKHFGFTLKDTMPMGDAGDYHFVDQGDVRLGGMMKTPAPHLRGGWQFYFGVPSVAAAKRAIEGGGGKIAVQPHQVPGGDWVLIATDPQGATFGVVGLMGD